MKQTQFARETFSCPECGEESSTYARICHACGREFSQDDKLAAPTQGSHNGKAASRQWEPLLGGGLLLLVIGFALFMWVGSNIQSSAYYDGMAAESSRDWDTAVVRFTEAGDYPGAQARLVSATRNRDDRDRLYKEGTEAAARKDWSAALKALEGVRDIQPGYGDSDALFSQAEEGAERAAAAGVVYLVTEGSQPGLYY